MFSYSKLEGRVAELLDSEACLLCGEAGEALRSDVVLPRQRLLGVPQRVLGGGPECTLLGGCLHSRRGFGHSRTRLPCVGVIGSVHPSCDQQPDNAGSNKHSLFHARL